MDAGAAVTVSVVMPFRDAAATIEEALASVLAQEGPAIEVLAVDDGSTDDGAARARSAATRALAKGRLRVLCAEGRGLVAALETGVRAARGELVARMDADDVSLPGRFARQVEALRAAPEVAAMGTRVEAFADPGIALGGGLLAYVAWLNELVSPDDHARDVFVEAPLCHPSVMLRRAALSAVGGYRDAPWAEDYDLWLRLHAAGYRLAKVPDVLLRWRHSRGRATFSDPRYAPGALREARAFYLAPWLRARGREVAVWGAGQTGKRLARALEQSGVCAARFVDIDPKKLGGVARGAPIVAPEALRRGQQTIVVAVGARGARALVRARLVEMGFREGDDFVCAA
jgi:glycosyltransferase involved in cell wall biosynthesis